MKSLLDKKTVDKRPSIQLVPTKIPTCRLDEYKIVKLLGEGAFGKVFLVETSQGPHALKEIKLPKYDIEMRRNVLNEMILLKNLQCIPNAKKCVIPKVFNVFQCETDDEVSYYIEMELIPKTLVDFVEEIQDLRYPKRLQIVSRIGLNLAKAINQLHQIGLLHLDLKPDNIGIKKTIKLLDFGYSCLWNPQVVDVIRVCPKTFGEWRRIGTEGFSPANLFQDRYALKGYDFYAWVTIMYLLLKGKYIDTAEDHLEAFTTILKEAKEAKPNTEKSHFLYALAYGLVPANVMDFQDLVDALENGRDYDEYDFQYS